MNGVASPIIESISGNWAAMKARGPEVDKIPSLRLDLDFLDTSGYAIIPVESAGVPMDASPELGNERPYEELVVTQILDERQAEDGNLVVEIKATCNGLVPELDSMLDFKTEGFEVVDTADQGLSVSQFSEESDDTLIVSERSWLLKLNAVKSNKELPEAFKFGTAKVDTKEVVYQRYVDSDLVSVEHVVSLEEKYGNEQNAWVNALILGVVGLVAFGLLIFAATRPNDPKESRSSLPERITPFTVLELLKQVQRSNGFGEQKKQELAAAINEVEKRYFGADIDNADAPDLKELATRWAPQG